jgi:hypothetical protein
MKVLLNLFSVCYTKPSEGKIMNKKTWYTTKLNEKKEEVIDRIQILRDGENPLPANKDWKLSPTDNVLHEETPVERYDENMRYPTDEE